MISNKRRLFCSQGFSIVRMHKKKTKIMTSLIVDITGYKTTSGSKPFLYAMKPIMLVTVKEKTITNVKTYRINIKANKVSWRSEI